MKKNRSYFKNLERSHQVFNSWVSKLELANGYEYEKIAINTSLGVTQIYGLNTGQLDLDALVIFPGFRTTSLIWDLDRGLESLSKYVRIYLVETNGQPNLSEGYSPSIKNLDYGKWGAEVFEGLKIDSAFVAGASFGGLVCMKLSLVAGDKVKGAFLLNPGCFRTISFGVKNLFYNLLPLIKSSERNIRKFLNEVVFHKPEHKLSEQAEKQLVDYLQLAITGYSDKTEKPYYMGDQLNGVSTDTYLLVGDKDILIPCDKSIENATKHLGDNLKDVRVFKNVGHGIECYKPCIAYIEETLRARGDQNHNPLDAAVSNQNL